MFGILFWAIQLDHVLMKHVNQQQPIYSMILAFPFVLFFLHAFIYRNTVLQGRPITPQTLEELADKLYESLLQEASVNFVSFFLFEILIKSNDFSQNELRVKPNINLSNVMKRFFRHHALKLLHILFDDRMFIDSTSVKIKIVLSVLLANNVWFERFRQQLTTMRNEYLALSSHCLEGGEAATIDFILNRHVNKKQSIRCSYT